MTTVDREVNQQRSQMA